MQLKMRKIFYQKKMTNSATFPKRYGKMFCLTLENTFYIYINVLIVKNSFN